MAKKLPGAGPGKVSLDNGVPSSNTNGGSGFGDI